jgi:uncharacterized protein (TIGR01777 family)
VKILVSGSTGLVGTAVMDAMSRQGHQMASLVRPSSKKADATGAAGARAAAALGPQSVLWDPPNGTLDSAADNADVVVHLAGASIAGGRWTEARKRVLRESRVAATRHLVAALGKLSRPPRIFIAASAIGYYGDRGDEELTESSAAGTGYLAQLSRDWETESARARAFGARVVILRFGIILAKHGGALPSMAFPFRLGIGGRIGSGRQWISWIALADVVQIIGFAIATEALSGPANVVAPQPVRNAEFTTQLGRVMHRPALFPTPGFVLRLALGEMADSLLLAGQRVLPSKLQQAGYKFLHPELQPALAAVLRE